MSIIRKNIIANFIGYGWAGGMNVLFVPLYLHFLGVEAYGLIGIFALLQSMVSLLDFGLSATVNRELAQLSAAEDGERDMGDLLSTLEIVYWMVAVCIGALLALIAPLITRYWIHPVSISPSNVTRALMLMGGSMALQWPVSFYSGAMMGLQKQVRLNVINIGISTLRTGGTVLALWWIAPTVQVFFTWQIVVSAIHSLWISRSLWSCIPTVAQPKGLRFHVRVFSRIWRFAIGMSAISLTVVILTQEDKFILSKWLSLESFGYYMLASTIAVALNSVILPVTIAIYPKLNQFVASGNEKELRSFYHQSCQTMAVLIMPIAFTIVFFSWDMIVLWLGDTTIADRVCQVASVMVLGTALNGMFTLPYNLQLAHGWTRLCLSMNVIFIILLCPLLILLASWKGPLGGAIVWLALNAGYIAVGIPLMHRKLLSNEMKSWYISDFLIPTSVAAAVNGFGKFLLPKGGPWLIQGGYILVVFVVGMGLTALSTPFFLEKAKRLAGLER